MFLFFLYCRFEEKKNPLFRLLKQSFSRKSFFFMKLTLHSHKQMKVVEAPKNRKRHKKATFNFVVFWQKSEPF